VDELDGPRYRRSRLCAPSAETRFLSITTVYMNSQEEAIPSAPLRRNQLCDPARFRR
jgi:hypothetical protein